MNDTFIHEVSLFIKNNLNLEFVNELDANFSKTFQLRERLFDVFEKVVIRFFVDTKNLNLEFVCCDIKDFRKLIFSSLGPDSNNIRYQEIPLIEPFGSECYSWYFDVNNNLVTEDVDFYYGFDLIVASDNTAELVVYSFNNI